MDKTSALKKLVVYYSMDGNNELLAKTVSEAAGADLLKLETKKPLPSHGFKKYFTGGMQALFGIKPELAATNVKPEDYDIIFIGTPVWASSPSSPVNSFLSASNLRNKRIGLFCSYDGNAGKTFEKLKNKLKENTIAGEIDFMKPLANRDKCTSDIREWAVKIAGLQSGSQA